MEDVQKLKQQIAEYERMLGIGEYDPVKNAFTVLVQMMNQQVDYLKNFRITAHIDSADKESPQYKRAMDMADGLPKMIASVNELRVTLKLTKEDMLKLQEKTAFTSARNITAESIADAVGELAGKRS
jgi:phenylacetate-coenzyme A ligase PaaK-like adenylate-forming protein